MSLVATERPNECVAMPASRWWTHVGRKLEGLTRGASTAKCARTRSLRQECRPARTRSRYQYFPGGSRADSGLIRISSGEFVVNGAATSRNRGLLEWINSGGDAMASLPARANGGGFASMPVSAGPREIQVVTPPGLPMALSVEDEALPGGGRREKYVLSEMVGNALTMPGGKARKAMQGQHGQRLVGPRR